LDGVRCISQGVELSSRTTKKFIGLDHIKEETKNIPYILDGELYSEELDFQTLTGLINRKKNIDDKNMLKIKFYVYDIVSNDDYEKRLLNLKKLFEINTFKYIKLHLTEECNTKEEIEKFHDEYVNKGYEGLIVRNKIGSYKEKYRSTNLQKFKKFTDSEFEIIGFTDGEGKEKGHIIWICKTDKGYRFYVRPKGSYEERSKLFKNGKKYIGKLLTVVYQELTNDGIPRFPTTRYGGEGDIRDYE
jgi:DNA ligase-1